MAWKALYQYNVTDTFLRADMIYADAHYAPGGDERSALCAQFPETHGIWANPSSMETRTCSYNRCSQVESTETTEIVSLDSAVEAAHNNALATHRYFLLKHGRKSFDNNGMTIISNVHWGAPGNVAAAKWDQNQMWYGDGNGNKMKELSF